MKRILTGDRPSGQLHIGHYVGTLKNRVAMQESHELFITIVDLHLLTDHIDPSFLADTRSRIKEMLLDYLSVGINPDKATIFIQSSIPEITQLAVILSNLISISRTERIPTLKEKIRDQHIQSPSLGLLNYPILQAADILSIKADVVPVGKDQASHIEVARELAKRFNQTYGEVFPEPQSKFGNDVVLPGLDGKAKMSKSLGNCIYLTDDEKTLQKKVMRMYTDPNRIHPTDPGNIEGNPVFSYFDAFHTDLNEVIDLKKRYKAGKIGDVALKQILASSLNQFLAPIKKRRIFYEKDPNQLNRIITQGSMHAREIIQQTLKDVLTKMSLL